MATLAPIENLKQLVKQVEPDFNALAVIHGAVNYQAEASFALQLLNDNSYLQQIAHGNPDSLKRAVINVAAIGLTLNPVHRLAYLVPRDRKVCLDVSYRGYIHLAAEAGAISWAQAEIVREADQYKYRGIGKEPEHEFDPFDPERGDIVGAYCVAKMPDGDFMVTVMSAKEIYGIRDRSVSWKAYMKDAGKTSPWNTDEAEMIKKTVIRRAYKTWPLVDKRHRQRFEKAVEAATEADPVEFGVPPAPDTPDTETLLSEIRGKLVLLKRTEAEFVAHLVRTNKRDLKRLEDLTTQEMTQANTFLTQCLTKRPEAPVANAN